MADSGDILYLCIKSQGVLRWNTRTLYIKVREIKCHLRFTSNKSNLYTIGVTYGIRAIEMGVTFFL